MVKICKISFLMACLLLANQALAVTQSVTARIAFAAPLSVTQDGDSCNLTVAGDKNQSINIFVDDGGSIAPGGATCAYDGADAGSCMIADAAAPGSGKNLQLAGTETATVSIVYQ